MWYCGSRLIQSGRRPNTFVQRCSNPGCQVPRGILFCSVAPNICGSSLPNVLHVTLSSSSSSFPPPVLRSMQVPGHLQDQFLGDSIPSCFSPVSKHPFSSYHIQQFQPSLSWPSNGPFSFWNIFKRFLHSSFFLTFFTHVLTIIFFLFFWFLRLCLFLCTHPSTLVWCGSPIRHIL